MSRLNGIDLLWRRVIFQDIGENAEQTITTDKREVCFRYSLMHMPKCLALDEIF